MLFYVSCSEGNDGAAGSLTAPFRSLSRARDAVRAARSRGQGTAAAARTPAAVFIRGGVCQLAHPLQLDASDSAVTWSAFEGESVLISAGATVSPELISPPAKPGGVYTVDLAQLNLTANDMGVLRPRGFPGGGGAGIAIWRFEPSGAELFYRPNLAGHAGRGQNRNAAEAQMHLARFPNIAQPGTPSTADWTQIHSVTAGTTIGLSTTMSKRTLRWHVQQAGRGDIMAHGLWSGTNWADSHRPVVSILNDGGIQVEGGAQLVLGNDEKAHHAYTTNLASGSNFYAYNVEAELDAPGEYYLNRQDLQLSFIPPRAAVARAAVLPRSATTNYAPRCTHLKPNTCFKGFRAIKIIANSANASKCCDMCAANAKCFSFSLNHGTKECYLHPAGHPKESQGNCDAGVLRGPSPSPPPKPPEPPAPPTPSPPSPKPPKPPPPPHEIVGSYHLSISASVLNVSGASDIRFIGLEFRHARGPGVVLLDCDRVVLEGCTVADNGQMGINITGGADCVVRGSEVSDNGDGGVLLHGGNRTTLEPSNHTVDNCTLSRNQRWILNYAPNVILGGVGNSVVSSELSASANQCVFFQGNDHTLHNNEVHHCAQQCADCGAIYSGRDWTYRGNQITRNKFHTIRSIFANGRLTAHAVYLDDEVSSFFVDGNTFTNLHSVLDLGGGRGNIFTHNLVNATGDKPVNFAHRAACEAKPGKDPYDFLKRVPYDQGGAWAKYPHLANILHDDPCFPKYNVLSHNVLCDGATSLVSLYHCHNCFEKGSGNAMTNNTHCKRIQEPQV
eukprot:SAG31_NODE_1113_length_9854_cov_2.770682_4_plen_786_part_00